MNEEPPPEFQPGIETRESHADDDGWLTAIAVSVALVLAGAALFNPANWVIGRVPPHAPGWLHALAWTHLPAHAIAQCGACVAAVALLRESAVLRRALGITLAGLCAGVLISLVVRVAVVVESSAADSIAVGLTRAVGSHALHATAAVVVALAWWRRRGPRVEGAQ